MAEVLRTGRTNHGGVRLEALRERVRAATLRPEAEASGEIVAELTEEQVALERARARAARWVETARADRRSRPLLDRMLEQFPLDTLKMVGTLKLAGRMYGLVQTKDGLVHRVSTGNYMGQADGKVTDVAASKITLVEIIPDGLGGYMERPAALALNE